MSDLTALLKIFEKAKLRSPMNDWDITCDGREPDSDPKATHVLVLGCPDGVGGYLSCEFDERGNILQAIVIQSNGYQCSCKWCRKDTKCEYHGKCEYCGREPA